MTWEEAIEYCQRYSISALWFPTSASESAAVYEFFKDMHPETGKCRLIMNVEPTM